MITQSSNQLHETQSSNQFYVAVSYVVHVVMLSVPHNGVAKVTAPFLPWLYGHPQFVILGRSESFVYIWHYTERADHVLDGYEINRVVPGQQLNVRQEFFVKIVIIRGATSNDMQQF